MVIKGALTDKDLLKFEHTIRSMDRQLGDDLYQEFWAKYLKKGKSRWKRYQVKTIARYLLKELRRKESRHGHESFTIIDTLIAKDGDPRPEVERRDFGQQVKLKVDTLPSKQRAALMAKVQDGETDRQAAERLGIPLETLRTRKKRAKRRLRASFAPHEADPLKASCPGSSKY